MKKYPLILLIGFLILIALTVKFGIEKKTIAPEPITYVLDQKFLADEVIDDGMIIFPEIITPSDNLFWFYRFHGKQAYATFYNDLYNLTFQDFGDSLDLQFEFFEDGLIEYVDGRVERFKKLLGVSIPIMVISLVLNFVLGGVIVYLKSK